MSKVGYLAILLVAVISASGCGVMRSVEQWKCDRLGMCHFGTRPSMQTPPPIPVYQGNTCPNQPGYGYHP